MKGYNTKTRYQVKLLLAVAALALFYESSGWSVIMSAAAGIYMFVKGKKESVKNLWWMSLSAISFMISLLLTISFYMNEIAGVKIMKSLSPDKCHLVQQCLACTLVASIVSSVFSEKPDAGAEEGEETDAKTSGRMFTKKADGDKKKSTAPPVKKVEEPKKKVVAVEDEDEEDAVVVEAAAKKQVETPEMKEETLDAAVEGQ